MKNSIIIQTLIEKNKTMKPKSAPAQNRENEIRGISLFFFSQTKKLDNFKNMGRRIANG